LSYPSGEVLAKPQKRKYGNILFFFLINQIGVCRYPTVVANWSRKPFIIVLIIMLAYVGTALYFDIEKL